MRQYLDLLRDVKENGVDRMDRTGVGTRSIFGRQMHFDLSKGFPLLTTKKVYWKGVVYELLWFISGRTDNAYLTEHNVHIWDEWANENGDLPYIYSRQWRNFGADGMVFDAPQPGGMCIHGEAESHTVPMQVINSRGIDQLGNVIEAIKKNPYSRRHLVVAWNPIELPKMALPPCHCLFQFYVANGKLSCRLDQRSCDVFLGLPFNIASYSLLTHMVASICGLEVGEFIWQGGDVHLYHNHFDQANTQLARQPFRLPKLIVNKRPNIEDFVYDDFNLSGYQYHPAIPAPIAV